VWLEGADPVDPEDLSVGPCGVAGGESCLYLADTGDNAERRQEVAIYRVVEPTAGVTRTAPAQRFPLRFPEGPRDVEAMYILPGERLFLVTKGRNHPVELFRVPPLPSAAADASARQTTTSGVASRLFNDPLLLERIQSLTAQTPPLPRWVTGASATPDGLVVAIRTYETLELFHPDGEGRLTRLPGGLVNLRVLGEPQGEAVAFVDGGDLVLTSEAGPLAPRGTIARLQCHLPGQR
jgi:hypothetical protein